jgi:hypothetical protein
MKPARNSAAGKRRLGCFLHSPRGASHPHHFVGWVKSIERTIRFANPSPTTTCHRRKPAVAAPSHGGRAVTSGTRVGSRQPRESLSAIIDSLSSWRTIEPTGVSWSASKALSRSTSIRMAGITNPFQATLVSKLKPRYVWSRKTAIRGLPGAISNGSSRFVLGATKLSASACVIEPTVNSEASSIVTVWNPFQVKPSHVRN